MDWKVAIMWTSSFDLHCHTTHSDGSLSVDDLAEEMAKQQVRVWSLTDHDTIAGWDEAKSAAEKRNIRFVPGVELTCDVELPWVMKSLKQVQEIVHLHRGISLPISHTNRMQRD